jgi:hypothetical protein
MSGELKRELFLDSAGVMSALRWRASEDGFELQFRTSFFGPFARRGMRSPVLQPPGLPPATAVLNRAAHRGIKKINFDDLQGKESFQPLTAIR